MMYMADWKTKLDAFLQLNEEQILTHAGTISAEMAKEFALSEYAKFEDSRKKEEQVHSEQELKEILSGVMAKRELPQDKE